MNSIEEKISKNEMERTPFLSESMRVRCPHCRKLYLVQMNDVKEAKPRFECVQCHSRFWLSLPDVDLQAELIGVPIHSRPTAVLATEGGLPRSKELAAAWKKVIAHYSDDSVHSDFLRVAQRERSLPFAGAQYAQMLKLMPTDDVAQKRIAEVQALGALVITSPENFLAMDKPTRRPPILRERRFLRVWQLPLVIAVVMMALGLVLPVFRNMVGVGAAFFFLALAIQIQFGRRN